MSLGASDGVLLIAHGTIDDLDDLPEFLARIRHGRPASAELVNELRHRYEVVGGSPLLRVTHEQASALGKRLEAPVLVGMRLWRPSVEDALRGCAHLGLERVCVLPLAPFSVHVYWSAAEQSLESVRAELGERAPQLVSVPPWGSEPEYVAAHAAQIAPYLERRSEADTELILTAHSLPTRAILAGDPYQTEFEACAAAIGERLGRSHRIAYQSQGADGGDWIGPDLDSVLEACRVGGKRTVVLAPVGFLADHIETLYDLDIEAKVRADGLGLELVRVPALNVQPGFIEALAAIVRRSLSSEGTV
jgi:ferrochelatase